MSKQTWENAEVERACYVHRRQKTDHGAGDVEAISMSRKTDGSGTTIITTTKTMATGTPTFAKCVRCSTVPAEGSTASVARVFNASPRP